jgi:hypothetical protein
MLVLRQIIIKFCRHQVITFTPNSAERIGFCSMPWRARDADAERQIGKVRFVSLFRRRALSFSRTRSLRPFGENFIFVCRISYTQRRMRCTLPIICCYSRDKNIHEICCKKWLRCGWRRRPGQGTNCSPGSTHCPCEEKAGVLLETCLLIL